LEKEKRHHLECFVVDVNAVDFGAQSFDRILCAAALQHFSLPEVVRLFVRASRWLAAEGLLLLTDILDLDRQWHFFDSPEREKAYFDHLSRDEPILGTWFHREWLMKLTTYAGFSKVEVLQQPSDFIYSHYRFDLLCQK
jgi:cyclopropane fatty-acyl-phospholipid synthase-like methyltransferase